MKPVVIPDRMMFKIGEVADILRVKTYVIRFWETEFPFLIPNKTNSGQRLYQRPQIEALVLVQYLLHEEKYSIEGARRRISELKKQGLYKSAVASVIDHGVLDRTVVERAAVERRAQHSKTEKETNSASSTSASGLKTSLPKDERNIQEIKEKLNHLRSLIRNPSQSGLKLPKLSELDSDASPLPSELKDRG